MVDSERIEERRQHWISQPFRAKYGRAGRRSAQNGSFFALMLGMINAWLEFRAKASSKCAVMKASSESTRPHVRTVVGVHDKSRLGAH
jgi:hypothetical protein